MDYPGIKKIYFDKIVGLRGERKPPVSTVGIANQPPYPPILQPLKLLAPELIESLKPLKHHVTSEAEALREMSSLMIWGLHNGA